jgi:hypothetical protein
VLFAALLIDQGAKSFSSVRSSRDGRIGGSVHAEIPPGAARSACCTINLREV